MVDKRHTNGVITQKLQNHSGPPDYSENPIVTYEEFCDKGYEEYYFTGEKPEAGRGFFIVDKGEPIGFISYSSFHLKPFIAELDIWINCEANCGKGFGTDAIISLGSFLNETMGVCELIIAPSRKNIRAIKSYEKAGFKKTNKEMSEFLLDEYVSIYGEGDYGTNETIILVKRLEANK